MSHYIFSGKIIDANSGISINNRAFRYADGLFESMYFTNGKLMFLDQHYNRLIEGMKVLRINTDNIPKKPELLELVFKLIKANDINNAARIRMQVFRAEGGLFLPENNECEYIIETTELNNTAYKLNTKGLHIGISKSNIRYANKFSQIKTIAKQEMILAAMDAKDNKWDDAIMVNSIGNVVETTNSNIFAIVNNNLYTPNISDGALDGIMRQNIIKIAKENNYTIIETSLNENNLLAADEIFITNAIKGIQWVVAYRNKRYFNNISKKLLALLNKKIYE